jgi:DNA-binding XRE family transcriptional regulator
MKTKDGIKNFRERMHYKTQGALAEALGIIPQNVSLWESGKGYPSFQIAKKLLELGAMVEEIFDIEYENMHYKEYFDNYEDLEREGALLRAQIEARFKKFETVQNRLIAELEGLKK